MRSEIAAYVTYVARRVRLVGGVGGENAEDKFLGKVDKNAEAREEASCGRSQEVS